MILKSLFLIVAMIATGASANVLEGSWKTDCVFVPKKHSAINEIIFSRASYMATTTMFATQDCKTENLHVVVEGRYKSTKTSEFHHTPESVTMILKNQVVVDHYNKNSVCGISNWVLDQSREVSGKFCNPYDMPKAEQLSFDIFQLTDGFLSFGGFPRKTFPDKKNQPAVTSNEWTYSKSSVTNN